MATYTADGTRDQVIVGGAEDDVFLTGRNSVILTGGGGADQFVFQYLPWNNTGHITDFTLGTDLLDFSALFADSGYSGSDPVADGFMNFSSDGSGGTRLFYDPDASGTEYQWPYLVTTLDDISPTGLTWAQLSDSSPPPPSGEQIPTTDGGYVELSYDWSGQPAGSVGDATVQKYDASGNPVGEAHTEHVRGFADVVALSDGGYSFVYTREDPDLFQTRATVFDAAAAVEADFVVSEVALTERDVAASPLGGFFVVTGITPALREPILSEAYLNMYDNSGAQTLHATVASGHPVTLPELEVLPDGTYQVTWDDDGTARSLTIDPNDPPDLSPPEAPDAFFIDDVAPMTGTHDVDTGPNRSSVFTNDTEPMLRFSVTEPGELEVAWGVQPGSGGRTVFNQIPITDADVSRGYVELLISASEGESTLGGWARIKDNDGITHDALRFGEVRIDTVAPVQPSITNVSDDVGADTGTVPNGGTTDDATPTLQVAIGSYDVFRESDSLQLVIDGTPAGSPVELTKQDLDQGSISVTTPTLSDGMHTLSATVTDGAGNVSAMAEPFSINVQTDDEPPASEGETLTADGSRDQVLTGGPGDDIFLTGQNSVIMTGGDGADQFVFEHLPWNNTGHIRDFTTDVDILDLRALFDAAGYTGSDPIGDGYLHFNDIGTDTEVAFDPDGHGTGNPWPITLTTLDGLQPEGIKSSDWFFA